MSEPRDGDGRGVVTCFEKKTIVHDGYSDNVIPECAFVRLETHLRLTDGRSVTKPNRDPRPPSSRAFLH